MKPQVLVLAPFLEQTLEPLHARFELIDIGADPRAGLAARAGEPPVRAALTIGNAPLDAEMVAQMPGLEFVCHYGAGYDQIDLAALERAGVAFANTPGANTACVADLALALHLTLVRQVVITDRGVRDGEWQRQGNRFGFGRGMAGRRVGILGLGAIGDAIARRAEAFGMEIGYHNRRPRADIRYRHFDSLTGLAGWADDLVIAAAASAANRGIVDAAVLRALGAGGYVINIARGSLIDEAALLEALREGRIAGAGLDVHASEPDTNPAFHDMPNVILTPHMAGKTDRALADTDKMFRSNLVGFFEDITPHSGDAGLGG